MLTSPIKLHGSGALNGTFTLRVALCASIVAAGGRAVSVVGCLAVRANTVSFGNTWVRTVALFRGRVLELNSVCFVVIKGDTVLVVLHSASDLHSVKYSQ